MTMSSQFEVCRANALLAQFTQLIAAESMPVVMSVLAALLGDQLAVIASSGSKGVHAAVDQLIQQALERAHERLARSGLTVELSRLPDDRAVGARIETLVRAIMPALCMETVAIALAAQADAAAMMICSRFDGPDVQDRVSGEFTRTVSEMVASLRGAGWAKKAPL